MEEILSQHFCLGKNISQKDFFPATFAYKKNIVSELEQYSFHFWAMGIFSQQLLSESGAILISVGINSRLTESNAFLELLCSVQSNKYVAQKQKKNPRAS